MQMGMGCLLRHRLERIFFNDEKLLVALSFHFTGNIKSPPEEFYKGFMESVPIPPQAEIQCLTFGLEGHSYRSLCSLRLQSRGGMLITVIKTNSPVVEKTLRLEKNERIVAAKVDVGDRRTPTNLSFLLVDTKWLHIPY